MPSLAEIGMQNRLKAGDRMIKAVRNSAGTCGFVWSWAVSTYELGRPPTQVEFAKTWGTSDRQIRNELTRFRETFPGIELDDMAAWLIEHARTKVESKSGALSLPALDSWVIA